MFVTNVLSEVEVLPFVQTQGERVWNSVSLRFHRPLLLVKYRASDPDADVCSSILFLSHPQQLAELCQNSTIEVVQASLIHQQIVDEDGHWKMTDIRSVWQGVEGKGDYAQYAYIYVFKNGDRHLEADASSSEVELREIDLLVDLNS